MRVSFYEKVKAQGKKDTLYFQEPGLHYMLHVYNVYMRAFIRLPKQGSVMVSSGVS